MCAKVCCVPVLSLVCPSRYRARSGRSGNGHFGSRLLLLLQPGHVQIGSILSNLILPGREKHLYNPHGQTTNNVGVGFGLSDSLSGLTKFIDLKYDFHKLAIINFIMVRQGLTSRELEPEPIIQ